VLETKDVEANLRTEELVARMHENEIAVFEGADVVDLDRALRQFVEHPKEAGDSIRKPEVVLLVRADVGERRFVSRLEALEERHGLFLFRESGDDVARLAVARRP